ncbi:hypothetical protein CCUN_1223 [Campylobacter cuniculorum DSM 23162 = LMG 24588]|uniref:DedA family protein n=1 Tax=Campylobacter cuniculorum DSM 23162 = LMG 24588 TaxID=1121267 RepID=A0A1W6BXH5_9BACT|nr:hypothetical protein CCUN_1223 [Campylobacter cuniculorum DSM 23162 = LMG 24588]
MLEHFSYGSLFMISFLSSTLVPLASEAFVLAFIKLDFNPYIVLFIATFANTLGSLSTYFRIIIQSSFYIFSPFGDARK